MINFIRENASTILVSLLLASIVFLILKSRIKRHRAGQGGCSSCSSCAASSLCCSAESDQTKAAELRR